MITDEEILELILYEEIQKELSREIAALVKDGTPIQSTPVTPDMFNSLADYDRYISDCVERDRIMKARRKELDESS